MLTSRETSKRAAGSLGRLSALMLMAAATVAGCATARPVPTGDQPVAQAQVAGVVVSDSFGRPWRVGTVNVALGVAGLHDWTLKGPHLCMTRLNLLRLNTMPALDPEPLSNLSEFREHLARVRGDNSPNPGWDNAQLRELGRLPYPMVREKGAPGFTRISWAEANDRLGRRLRTVDPRRLAFFVMEIAFALCLHDCR